MSDDQNHNRNEFSSYCQDLRDKITSEFEAIETEYAREVGHLFSAPGKFELSPWQRDGGGGGVMGVMRGQVFEKVGVNISTVHGEFPLDFAKKIPGAGEDNRFWASGLSLVAHMRSPHVPAVHMNIRHISTTKSWFGGGADLTPYLPNKRDAEDFHAAFKDACDAHDMDYYERYKKWCDEYFYLPHRKEPRGIGGIFCDDLRTGDFSRDFSFIRSIGETFNKVYPMIVRRNMFTKWSAEEKEQQLIKRGRYVEFNLIYDRGTLFGLKTNGNTEAILMSMPPEVKWP